MASLSCKKNKSSTFLCKLCLDDVNKDDIFLLSKCHCKFCIHCMNEYLRVAINEGNILHITCPDSQCRISGRLTDYEIESLTTPQLFARYERLSFEREIDLDPRRAFCPKAGCETVCTIPQPGSPISSCLCSDSTVTPSGYPPFNDPSFDHEASASTPAPAPVTVKKKPTFTLVAINPEVIKLNQTPVSVRCPKCSHIFCSVCKQRWHGTSLTCDEASPLWSHLGIPYSQSPANDSVIKRCPACRIPIERNHGCAQMMCKRCKHVFCWYCLTSLNDDFFLRHYDKGPCKNKLGHSRASVMVHRAQVIGIFVGFSVLMLIASPFLLLAVPCILCCKCKKHCAINCFSTGTTTDDHSDIEKPSEQLSTFTSYTRKQQRKARRQQTSSKALFWSPRPLRREPDLTSNTVGDDLSDIISVDQLESATGDNGLERNSPTLEQHKTAVVNQPLKKPRSKRCWFFKSKPAALTSATPDLLTYAGTSHSTKGITVDPGFFESLPEDDFI